MAKGPRPNLAEQRPLRRFSLLWHFWYRWREGDSRTTIISPVGALGGVLASMNWHSLRTLIVGVGAVLSLWFVALGAVTLFLPAGAPVAVVARGGALPAIDTVVAAGGSILQVVGNTVVAISRDEGFVPRLYRNGALLVLAAETGGCIFSPKFLPAKPIPLDSVMPSEV